MAAERGLPRQAAGALLRMVRMVARAVLPVVLVLCGGIAFAMAETSDRDRPETGSPHAAEAAQQAARSAMVEQQIRARGIAEPEVLAAMEQVPRHLFVAPAERAEAYEDRPLSIGYGQTISQPFIVALMTSLANLRPDGRVLEIGTGSGYQAAVLSRVAGQVYSIEIVAPLAQFAQRTLASLGYDNVHVRVGDGYRGWPEAGPFDAIVVTAAPLEIPAPLLDQLKPGGRMVLPVGDVMQYLQVLTKRADGGYDRATVAPVRFVPMTGEAQRHRPPAQ
jgi:protein-L-isoaspartate(D-aspartate) O-methyltransferase